MEVLDEAHVREIRVGAGPDDRERRGLWTGGSNAGALLAGETDPSSAARSDGLSAAAVADCEALPTTDFTTIQDAPTQVTGSPGGGCRR